MSKKTTTETETTEAKYVKPLDLILGSARKVDRALAGLNYAQQRSVLRITIDALDEAEMGEKRKHAEVYEQRLRGLQAYSEKVGYGSSQPQAETGPLPFKN